LLIFLHGDILKTWTFILLLQNMQICFSFRREGFCGNLIAIWVPIFYVGFCYMLNLYKYCLFFFRWVFAGQILTAFMVSFTCVKDAVFWFIWLFGHPLSWSMVVRISRRNLFLGKCFWESWNMLNMNSPDHDVNEPYVLCKFLLGFFVL